MIFLEIPSVCASSKTRQLRNDLYLELPRSSIYQTWVTQSCWYLQPIFMATIFVATKKRGQLGNDFDVRNRKCHCQGGLNPPASQMELVNIGVYPEEGVVNKWQGSKTCGSRGKILAKKTKEVTSNLAKLFSIHSAILPIKWRQNQVLPPILYIYIYIYG